MNAINNGHFPIEILKDKVKDIFEHAVSKIMHNEAIDNGLNRALKFHQTDKPVKESAYISENAGTHTINTFDNYWQYLWLINYYLVVTNDCGIILAQNVKNGRVSTDRASILLKNAQYIWNCALKMTLLGKSDPEYMEQPRGEIFTLPSPLSPNEYTDYADSLTVFGLGYILQHEYGHFIKEHYEDTPYNELEADRHSIKHILGKCSDINEELTAIIGISISLAATGFINTSLVSTLYPDLDNRIETAISLTRDEIKGNPNSVLYQVLNLITIKWIEFVKPDEISTLKLDKFNSSKEALCFMRESIINPYKKQFKT